MWVPRLNNSKGLHAPQVGSQTMSIGPQGVTFSGEDATIRGFGTDHPWRERPLGRRAHAQCHRANEPRRPVRAALWANGAADFVHDPGAALHEDLWLDARATGDGLSRAARVGGEEPARHLQDADHRRGSAELADERLPVPAIAVLPSDRWRRRLDPGFGRPREGLPAKAGLPPRHRRECRDADGQPDGGFPLLARVPRRRPKAFAEAGITHNDVDHLMIYDAPCSLPGAGFAHLPIYGLEDLGFVPRGEAGAFITERDTAPGGKLPLNTNGGGLSYMHSGMYGMYALQESVRQMRGTAPAQIPDAEISVCHGVGGMFAASGTIIMSNEVP